MAIGKLLVEIWGFNCVGTVARQINELDRGYHQNNNKTTTLTANAAAINPRQQQVKDGDGRVVIGLLLMEIWGINCVGAAASQIKSIG